MTTKDGETRSFPGYRELFQRLNLIPIEALGKWAWHCQAANGTALVLKTGPRASAPVGEFLEKLSHLYTPFHYPRNLGLEAGRFLLYPYITGQVLAQEDFETPAIQAAIMELAGRLGALFRSLRLAPMYQAFKSRWFEAELADEAARVRPARLHMERQNQPDTLSHGRREAVQSYHWAVNLVKTQGPRLIAADGPSAALMAAFLAKVEQTTSIHLSARGTNLAHAAFTPEHLLICPDGQLGVVGWEIGPRPYNYMRLRYLAWSLIYSDNPDILRRYRSFLTRVPTVSPRWATYMGFALGLMESWPESPSVLTRRREKLAALTTFLEDSLGAEIDNPSEAIDVQ